MDGKNVQLHCVLSTGSIMVTGIGYLQMVQYEPLYRYKIYIGNKKLLTHQRV